MTAVNHRFARFTWPRFLRLSRWPPRSFLGHGNRDAPLSPTETPAVSLGIIDSSSTSIMGAGMGLTPGVSISSTAARQVRAVPQVAMDRAEDPPVSRPYTGLPQAFGGIDPYPGEEPVRLDQGHRNCFPICGDVREQQGGIRIEHAERPGPGAGPSQMGKPATAQPKTTDEETTPSAK